MRAASALGALAAALGLGACTEAGSAMTRDEQRFAEGVTRAGCTVTNAAQAAIVEDHTGFDADKLRTISNALLERGVLTLEGENIRLTTGTCANA